MRGATQRALTGLRYSDAFHVHVWSTHVLRVGITRLLMAASRKVEPSLEQLAMTLPCKRLQCLG